MYRVRTDDAVLEQVAALPNEALGYYAQVLVVLELAPWNGKPYKKDNPEGNMRQLILGTGGEGFVTYLILEDQRLVDILKVMWAG